MRWAINFRPFGAADGAPYLHGVTRSEFEQRWAQAFGSSQDELAKLADEASREFEAGETLPLDPAPDFPNQ